MIFIPSLQAVFFCAEATTKLIPLKKRNQSVAYFVFMGRFCAVGTNRQNSPLIYSGVLSIC